MLGGGDELRLFASLAPTMMGSPREEFAGVLRAVGAGNPPWTRLGMVGRALADPRGKQRSLGAYCEVAVRFASRMGLRWAWHRRWPSPMRAGTDAGCRAVCPARTSPPPFGSRSWRTMWSYWSGPSAPRTPNDSSVSGGACLRSRRRRCGARRRAHCVAARGCRCLGTCRGARPGAGRR
jgi:hypothetical protein